MDVCSGMHHGAPCGRAARELGEIEGGAGRQRRQASPPQTRRRPTISSRATPLGGGGRAAALALACLLSAAAAAVGDGGESSPASSSSSPSTSSNRGESATFGARSTTFSTAAEAGEGFVGAGGGAGQAVGSTSNNLPMTVLPSVSRWLMDKRRGDASAWRAAFDEADRNKDGRLRLKDVGFIFKSYLAQSGVPTLDFTEDVRRFHQVVEQDAHAIDSSQQTMGFSDFSLLMDGCVARLLSPREYAASRRGKGSAEHRALVDSALSHPAGPQRDSALARANARERVLVYDEVVLLSPADEHATVHAQSSSMRRNSLERRRTRPLELATRVSLQAPDVGRRRAAGLGGQGARRSEVAVMCEAYFEDTYMGAEAVNATEACPSGSYYDTGGEKCEVCDSCQAGYERTGCTWCSPGECTACREHYAKPWVGNESCSACPPGSGTLFSQADNRTACYRMWTCRQWRDWAGSNVSRVHMLAKSSSGMDYRYPSPLSFGNDGITPVGEEALPAYCDQEEDGGGWMLFMNYYRSGRDNANPPNPKQIPLDPNWGGIGFSHIYLKSFTAPVYQNATEIRLYCNSSAHDRVVHFKTSFNGIVTVAKRGVTTYNNASWWTFNTTYMDDHTGFLPNATDSTNEDDEIARSDRDGLTEFPFYRKWEYHWAIGAGGGRWECDDLHNFRAATHHRAWSR